MQGPILQPFVYDEAHPYAAGQHRGIDLGADAGATVSAPAGGTVSFAGSVPTNGKSVTIETADGYSVTLTHLGSITVGKGATVVEQDAIGTVGPSGTPEVDGPYVHLGIRVTADPNGYVDPASLLPPDSAGDSTTPPPPTTSTTPAAAPAKKPASSAWRSRPVATTRGAKARPARSHSRAHQDKRAQKQHSETRTSSSRHRPAVRTGVETHLHARPEHAKERTASRGRPVVVPVAPQPDRRNVDDQIQLRDPAATPAPLRRPTQTLLVPAICNGLPALLAVAAALAAARTRRRRRRATPTAAQVVQLPSRVAAARSAARAA